MRNGCPQRRWLGAFSERCIQSSEKVTNGYLLFTGDTARFMANIYRLILALALAWSGSASAITPVYSYSWRVPNGTVIATGAGSPNAGWVAYITGIYGAGKNPQCGAIIQPYGYPMADCTSQFMNQRVASFDPSPSCPANSTLSGSVCVCNSPAVENAAGDACEAPNKCRNFGQLLSSYNGSIQMVQGASTACMGGCQVRFRSGYEGADLYGAGSDGVMRGWVPIGQLESAEIEGVCGSPSSPDLDPVPDSERPPPGTCPGEMNGVSLNVPCSFTESKDKKTTVDTDSSGQKTTTTESTTTVCNAAGSCTTTTTTTINTGSGATTTTKETTESKGDFCGKNASSPECGDGDGSAFTGACSAGFTCSGDALQCAIAKEQHRRACQLFESDSDERQAYEADKIKGRDGVDQTGSLSNQTVIIGPADFDSSDAIGGAQCITDKSIVVVGRTINIPMSNWCPYLEYIGQILVVVGYLLGARILIRG